MVYRPLTTLDAVKAAKATATLLELFRIPSLRNYQEKAGQNILLGKNTFLDVPTGGGKTLSFYYPLFYHWQPGSKTKKSQKIILVIGPLSGLMKSQARDLVRIGVPAVALTRETEDLEKELKVTIDYCHSGCSHMFWFIGVWKRRLSRWICGPRDGTQQPVSRAGA